MVTLAVLTEIGDREIAPVSLAESSLREFRQPLASP
jgi:hypothetical protein